MVAVSRKYWQQPTTYDISRFGVNFVSVPEEADALVIQGFYNEIGEERLLEIYSRMKKPKWVIATGKCIVDRCLLNEDYNFTERLGKIINVDFCTRLPSQARGFIYAVLRLLEAGQ